MPPVEPAGTETEPRAPSGALCLPLLAGLSAFVDLPDSAFVDLSAPALSSDLLPDLVSGLSVLLVSVSLAPEALASVLLVLESLASVVFVSVVTLVSASLVATFSSVLPAGVLVSLASV